MFDQAKSKDCSVHRALFPIFCNPELPISLFCAVVFISNSTLTFCDLILFEVTRLPRKAVESRSVEVLKKPVDMALRDMV